jgi:membrane protein
LPSELLSLLTKTAHALQATLGTHLDKVYPPHAANPPRHPVPHPQESET